MKSFAEQLKAARVKHGVTQEQLASRAEMSKSAVQYLEAGTQQPKASTVAKICWALGDHFTWDFNGMKIVMAEEGTRKVKK